MRPTIGWVHLGPLVGQQVLAILSNTLIKTSTRIEISKKCPSKRILGRFVLLRAVLLDKPPVFRSESNDRRRHSFKILSR